MWMFEHNMRNTHIKYDTHPSFPSWDIVFLVFHILTSGDFKWLLTSTTNNGDHLLNIGHPLVKYENHLCFPSLDTVFTENHLCFPSLDTVFTWFSEFDWAYMVFRVWPLVSSNDLWPLPKPTGIIYSIWSIYRPSMRSIHVSLLEILCLQSFQSLTSGDLNWPLTNTKNNKDYLPNMEHPQVKYEANPCFPSWDIVFTRFSLFDLWWPQMTFDLHQEQYGSSCQYGASTD